MMTSENSLKLVDWWIQIKFIIQSEKNNNNYSVKNFSSKSSWSFYLIQQFLGFPEAIAKQLPNFHYLILGYVLYVQKVFICKILIKQKLSLKLN